ncbi:unnamed protein product [Paramecium sonneborni]|uniref:Uncharacterized protein n=1 Tax=Paramecium sonneborni TaxID=65129 RepID=A0A8S1LVE7_9CILI|nr:unnamed protein product [Paramecium sonneborni]
MKCQEFILLLDHLNLDKNCLIRLVQRSIYHKLKNLIDSDPNSNWTNRLSQLYQT